MPITLDPLLPAENVRAAAISELWKAQHGIKAAAQALQDCNHIAAAHPLLHHALMPLIGDVVGLHSDVIALRKALEQS